jgi:lysozyme
MNPRIVIAALSLSAAALVGLAVHEGYRGDAYTPVPGDRPTLGFGDANGVKLGDTTNPVRALIRLQETAEQHAQGVRRCAPVPMLQREFDAAVLITFNIGIEAFCRSTIARRFNAGDYAGACDAFLMWDKFQGRTLRGLTIRRERERALCLGESQ